MNRCPICHARSSLDLIASATKCHRCGSDLSLLLMIEQKAQRWLGLACRYFINGKKQQALKCVQYSLTLFNNPLAKFLQVFITQNGYSDE